MCTLMIHEVVSVPAIEKFWASCRSRSGCLSASDNRLSKISSKTVLLSLPSLCAFRTLSMLLRSCCKEVFSGGQGNWGFGV